MTTIRSAGIRLALIAGAAGLARGQGAQPTAAELQSLFQRLDVNKDGVVQRSEVPPRAMPAFERLLKAGDKNNDGKLDTDEMRAVARSLPAAPAGGGGAGRGAGVLPPAFAGDPLARFNAMDKDKDGKVSRAEFTGRPMLFERLDANKDGFIDRDEIRPLIALAKGSMATASTPPGGQQGGRLMAMDKDGDGKVSKKEFTGAPAMFDRIDADSDGYLTKAEAAEAPKVFLREIKKMDTNGDGKISREEFRGPPERFDALDTDMDGFVTTEELARAAPTGGAAMPAADPEPTPTPAKKKPKA